MINSKWGVIVNPNAGGGRVNAEIKSIEELLLLHNINHLIYKTERANHAFELTKKAIEAGCNVIVAIGGDGSVNEVVNGIMKQQAMPITDLTFGCIPIGTGSDWSKMHSISNRPKEAFQTLLNGDFIQHDIGLVEYKVEEDIQHRYFINVAGLAIDAFIAKETSSVSKVGVSGHVLYFTGLMKALNRFTPQPCKVVLDDELEFENNYLSINIGICKYSGGGMSVVPKAIADDGLFEVTLFEKLNLAEALNSIKYLYNMKLYNHKKAHHYRAKKIVVTASPPTMLETDGEVLGTSPAEFTILPNALKTIVAKKESE